MEAHCNFSSTKAGFFFKLAAILKEASGRSYPVTQEELSALLSCFTIAEKIIDPKTKLNYLTVSTPILHIQY